MTLLLSLACVNSVILTTIGLLHFYWAIKGSTNANAIPTTEEGKRVLNPKRIDCVIVGVFLLFFAFLFLVRGEFIFVALPQWLQRYGVWAISFIFFLRFIGDFRYVGMTKKIHTTKFATLDTKYYSPLCLIIAVNGIVLELLILVSIN